MSEGPTLRALAAQFPRADIEPAHHHDGPRLCARLTYPGGRHALAMGPAAEVADWLKENYDQTPAGATRPDPVTSAGHHTARSPA